MTTTHTPGPWRATKALNQMTDDGTTVAQVGSTVADARNWWICSDAHSHGNRESDARLIAAAPETAAERDRLRHVNADLLAALAELSYWSDRINSLQHAGMNILASTWSELWDATNKARAALAKAEGR